MTSAIVPETELPDASTPAGRLYHVRVRDVVQRTGVADRVVHSLLAAWRDAVKRHARDRGVAAHKLEEKEARNIAEYPWGHFLGGHWTMFRPRRSGWYLRADREGNFRDIEYIDPAAPMAFREPWAGWYWDRPIPGSPKPPPECAK